MCCLLCRAASSRERLRERRLSRERSLQRERRRSSRDRSLVKLQDDRSFEAATWDTSRSLPVKRTQSGRLVDNDRLEISSFSQSRFEVKPRALSFRVSPAKYIPIVEQHAVHSTVKQHAVHSTVQQHAVHSAVHSTVHSSVHSSVQHQTQKSAKYSETHFVASEAAVDEVDRAASGLPPPLPARRGRGPRASEPVIFPSMPAVDLADMDTDIQVQI